MAATREEDQLRTLAGGRYLVKRSAAPDIPFGWQEFGPLFFFLGLLALAIVGFQSRFPIFQMWQPPSELELLGVEPIEEQVTAPMDDEIL